jgi:hypothetical protein
VPWRTRQGEGWHQVRMLRDMIKMINSRIHAFADYFTGLTLLMLPWIFNFSYSIFQEWLPFGCGAILIFYSLLTNYEMSVFKLLAFRTHLMLDFFIGLLLCLSPWLFGFRDQFNSPHLFCGAFIIVLSVLTDTVLYSQQRYETSGFMRD